MVNISLVGRLTADPTINEINGRACCNFTVAARTRKRDAGGNYVSDFYRVAVWGAQGENCAKYLGKGSQVAVSGSAEQSPYMSNTGEPRSGMQVTAYTIDFITTKTQNQNNAPDEEDMFS